jgi:hypothetical protein
MESGKLATDYTDLRRLDCADWITQIELNRCAQNWNGEDYKSYGYTDLQINISVNPYIGTIRNLP